LFALIRMDEQDDFIMTHADSLWMKPPPASVGVQQGKPKIIGERAPTFFNRLFQQP
jgi:hypothetical protein